MYCVQTIPPHKGNMRQHSGPHRTKIRAFVWSWKNEDMVTLIASDSSGTTVCYAQGNWHLNYFPWLWGDGLLLMRSDFSPNYWLLTTGCFLSIVPSSSTCRMCLQRRGWSPIGKAFENQSGRNLRTKGLQKTLFVLWIKQLLWWGRWGG